MSGALAVHGVDISHWQSDVDIKAGKAAGVQWMYHKAVEGQSVIDPLYTVRRENAAKVGMPFGGYAFASPDGGDAYAEALFFLRVADPRPGDMTPMLDLERRGGLSRAALTRWAKTWVDVVSKAIGFMPILYVGKDENRIQIHLDSTLQCLLWVPRYNPDNRAPAPVEPWGNSWAVWQFSGGQDTPGNPSSVPGFGAVDLNTMADGIDLSDLRIPRKVKHDPEPLEYEELNLMQSSMQYSDTTPQIEEDVRELFTIAEHHRVASIGFSEATRGEKVHPSIAAEAKRRGWWFQAGVTSDFRFCLSPRMTKLHSGYTPVLEGHGGPGAYSNRGITELTFETPMGNNVTVHGQHWLTDFKLDGNPKIETEREALNVKQTKAMRDAVLADGEAERISFWQGDTNVDEEKDTGFDINGIEHLFSEAGLVSVYDEMVEQGKMIRAEFPGTIHSKRGATIDIIGRSKLDSRVEAEEVIVFRPGNKDHLNVIAKYRIRTRKAA